jgi:glycerophosphoryl diester phosphodiesterase
VTEERTREPGVLAIAHRGASRDRPENTLIAFDEALNQGADALELDLQFSRDGVPVVYHDKTLARAGGGRRRVARLDMWQLRQLDAGFKFAPEFRGQTIPTLAEVLERYGQRTKLLLEVKNRESDPDRLRELMRAVIGLIRGYDVAESVQVLSFDYELLTEAADLAPGVGRVLNVRPGPLLDDALRARLTALSALSADVRGLTPEFAAAVDHAGCPLYVYTCNSTRRVRTALNAGAAGIMSDRPGWLARGLRTGELE